MTNRHRLRVSSDGRAATVELDGRSIGDDLRGLTVSFDAARGHPVALLDVLVHPADIDADNVKVALSAATHTLLVALGWTPPASNFPETGIAQAVETACRRLSLTQNAAYQAGAAHARAVARGLRDLSGLQAKLEVA